MDYHDISVYECNEAFAAIDELFVRKFPDAADRYNIFGRRWLMDIHMARQVGLYCFMRLKALEYSKLENNNRYAICSIAAAGGTGTAVLLKHISLEIDELNN